MMNPASPSVTICMPAANATATSPVHVVAGTTSATTVTYIQVYVDGVKQYEVKSARSIDTSIDMIGGAHRLTLQASNGTVFKATENIIVGGSTTGTVTVTVSSPAGPLNPRGTRQFTATVQNSTNTAVTWSVDGVTGGNRTGGTISAGGFYTAAAVTGDHMITAVSSADKTKSGSKVVNVGSTVSVSPVLVRVAPMGQQQFSVTTQDGNPVNWSVDGVAGGSASTGTISSTGLYIASGTPGTHTITATSSATSSQSNSAIATVNADTAVPPAVLTWHNDIARTGQNTRESLLTPANVNSSQFGKVFSFPVDGEVYAQPLYVPNLNIAGGVHNVVYVATEHDGVYAFDADGLTGTPLWQKSFINPSAGVTSWPASPQSTGIMYEIGITGTPFIDLSSGTMYLVAVTKEGSNASHVFRLHALDIRTGGEKFGGPVQIPASSTGSQSSIAYSCYQRSGLLLLNGVVYLAFGHCGYHGWLLGYSATTLQPVNSFNTTPTGGHAGIWGGAPSSDGQSIYTMTGDGTFDADTGGSNYGDAILELQNVNGNLTVTDWFSPYNTQYLFTTDQDLGSGGMVVLPPNSSVHPHEIVGGGKQGVLYLVDRDNMGHFHAGSDSQIVQEIPHSRMIHNDPAYWNGNLYLFLENGKPKHYKYANGVLSGPVSQGNIIFVQRGATPSVSANGNADCVIWAIQNDAYLSKGPAILRAFDPNNIATEFYNSAQAGARDEAGAAVRFTVPTIANGKVYVGTGNQLTVYGLLN